MSRAEFAATFNAAVSAEDWALVTILGEQAVADNMASNDVLYNLGLAYLKLGKAPMATAVLVSIPPRDRDASVTSVLHEALRQTDSSIEDLSLSAHGLKSSLVILADSMPTTVIHGATMTGLGCLLICVLGFMTGRQKKVLKQTWTKTLGVLGGLILLVSLISLLVQIKFRSDWGVVIAPGGVEVREAAVETAGSIASLRLGQPVLVFGDVRGSWLQVWDGSGHKGWVNALDVRVIPSM